MKGLIQNKITYKITGERGDFFITEDNKGKLKMFAKSTVEVIEIDAMPKAKVFKSSNVKPTDAQHSRTMLAFREAEFQGSYLECQRSTKF